MDCINRNCSGREMEREDRKDGEVIFTCRECGRELSVEDGEWVVIEEGFGWGAN
jgi:hypothetical protein